MLYNTHNCSAHGTKQHHSLAGKSRTLEMIWKNPFFSSHLCSLFSFIIFPPIFCPFFGCFVAHKLPLNGAGGSPVIGLFRVWCVNIWQIKLIFIRLWYNMGTPPLPMCVCFGSGYSKPANCLINELAGMREVTRRTRGQLTPKGPWVG